MVESDIKCSLFEEFNASLNNLLEDQSLFVADPIENHEELVSAGQSMCDRLEDLRNSLGEVNIDNLAIDESSTSTMQSIMEAITAYHELLMPKKACGPLSIICAACFNRRSGTEYERKKMSVHSNVANATFAAQILIIEHQGEFMHNESSHLSDCVKRVGTLATELVKIKSTGGESQRESARQELLSKQDQVNNFIKQYIPEDNPMRAEAESRIIGVGEKLTARRKSAEGVHIPMNRRFLVSAQVTMQEIMNTAAGISHAKAKESIDFINKQLATLEYAKNDELKVYEELTPKMRELELDNLIENLKEVSDVRCSNTRGKLQGTLKRWRIIEKDSERAVKPIVVYEEEPDPYKPSGDIQADAQHLMNKAGKSMTSISKQAARLPGNVAKSGTNFVGGALGGVTSIASEVVGGIGKGVKGAVGGVKGVFQDLIDGGDGHTTSRERNKSGTPPYDSPEQSGANRSGTSSGGATNKGGSHGKNIFSAATETFF